MPGDDCRSGNDTVPQIFIGKQAIGGFDELYALDKNGDLDRLFGVEAQAKD